MNRSIPASNPPPRSVENREELVRDIMQTVRADAENEIVCPRVQLSRSQNTAAHRMPIMGIPTKPNPVIPSIAKKCAFEFAPISP